jgi:hypothetical protein
LREEALHEIFARIDAQGSQLLAVHPQPNENAWLLGLAALRQEQHVGMVGARGLAPLEVTSSPGGGNAGRRVARAIAVRAVCSPRSSTPVAGYGD